MDVVLIIVALVAGDLVLWILLMGLIARLGGWHAVARRYSTSVQPEGQLFKWQFGTFRWIDYNACLKVVVAPAGLYLSVWPILRLGHPALLIPWSALHFVEVRKTLFANQALFDIDAPAIVRIRIPLRVYEAAKAYLPAVPPAGTMEMEGKPKKEDQERFPDVAQ